jgi:dipeptidyl aminopeptidase/acylaminoacyl peptidase
LDERRVALRALTAALHAVHAPTDNHFPKGEPLRPRQPVAVRHDPGQDVMTFNNSRRVVLAWLFLASSHVIAQGVGYPSNEDLRHIRGLSDPHIAPGGGRVLVHIADATAEGGRTHLWLVDVARNESRQITFSPDSDKAGERHGRWLGSDEILFLAKRADHTGLFRLPMGGGEPQAVDLKIEPPVDNSRAADALPPHVNSDGGAKLEPVQLEIDDFWVAPDARHVAVLARDPETSGEKQQREAKADAVWVDHETHGERLYLFDPKSGLLTPAAVPPDVTSLTWSPSGKRLLAFSGGQNNLGDLGPNTTAWLVTAQNPESPSRVKELPHTIQSAQWSKDEARLYFLAQAEQDAPPSYADLYAMDLLDRKVRNLSTRFDSRATLGGTPMWVAHELWLGVQIGTRTGYARLQGDQLRIVSFERPVVSALDCTVNGSACVWLGEGSSQPGALYFSKQPGRKAQRLETPRVLPGSWPETEPQTVHWHNEGFDIEGLLYMPAHAAGVKLPLIVDVHGGPTEAWDQSFEPLLSFWMGQGFAVFKPNPRGSSAYGVAFVAANKNDLGGGDYRDIMSGLDAVLANYPIDADKLILLGYSYGGEIAGFAEGRTDRFRAIISGAPIIDQQSEYGTEGDSSYDRWFYGRPWDNAEAAWRQSPLSLVAHAKSDFLLIQGEADTSDPPEQSREMYRALRQVGVHVEMVQYPREGHQQLRQGMLGLPVQEPWHGFDVRRRIVKFIKDALAKP